LAVGNTENPISFGNPQDSQARESTKGWQYTVS
jgi:hypothetical protein